MKIKYFQKGGTQLDLNREYVINSANASGNYGDLRKMIEGDGSLYNLNAKQRYISNGGTEAGFDRMNQLADEVYANFIKNNPIENPFTTPIKRLNPIIQSPVPPKPVTDWNKIAADNNLGDMEGVKKFQEFANTQGYNLAVDGKLGNLTNAALNNLGNLYELYLTNPDLFNRSVAHGMANFVESPASNISTGIVPVYDASGNLTGLQKKVYYGQGQEPIIPNQQRTPTTPSSSNQLPSRENSDISSGYVPYNAAQKRQEIMSNVKNWFSNVAENNRQYRLNLMLQNTYNYEPKRYVIPFAKGTQYTPSRKNGGSINFLQQGGALAYIQKLPKDQQQQLLQAFGQWALQKGIDINQLLNDPNALNQALEQFMQEMQSQKAQRAEKGAKLQFIKSLRGICPEGEELTYMKKGGVMCPVCKKKAQAKEKVNKKEYFKKSSKKGEDGMKAPLVKCGKKVMAKGGCKTKKK